MPDELERLRGPPGREQQVRERQRREQRRVLEHADEVPDHRGDRAAERLRERDERHRPRRGQPERLRGLVLPFGNALEPATDDLGHVEGLRLVAGRFLESIGRLRWPPFQQALQVLRNRGPPRLLVIRIEAWVDIYRELRSGLARSTTGYVFHQFLAAGIAMVVLGVPAALIGAVLPLLIRGAASLLDNFLGLHESAKDLEAFAAALESGGETTAVLDEAIRTVGRLSHWLDLDFPWMKLNAVAEDAAKAQ